MSFETKEWKNDPDPSTAIDAAALIDLETRLAAYTDAQISSLPDGPILKTSAATAGTANGDLATDFNIGDSLDSVALVANMRFALFGQTDPTANGLYVPNASGPPTRVSDLDDVGEFYAGALVFIDDYAGNLGGTLWMLHSDKTTWTQLGGKGLLTSANGGFSALGADPANFGRLNIDLDLNPATMEIDDDGLLNSIVSGGGGGSDLPDFTGYESGYSLQTSYDAEADPTTTVIWSPPAFSTFAPGGMSPNTAEGWTAIGGGHTAPAILKEGRMVRLRGGILAGDVGSMTMASLGGNSANPSTPIDGTDNNGRVFVCATLTDPSSGVADFAIVKVTSTESAGQAVLVFLGPFAEPGVVPEGLIVFLDAIQYRAADPA